jgi:hypothetical protein
MHKIVWIVRVDIVTDNGLKPLQAAKVFENSDSANRYQDNINNDPVYKNINAFAFVEPAIFVED